MDKKEEMRLISKIADRALKTTEMGALCKKIDLVMDIDFVHRDCALNLQRLLEADSYNFYHDVFGIYKNFNRTTKRLENCFVPRFTSNVLCEECEKQD